MTVGELIAQLAKHNPDLPVFVTVEDEFDTSHPVELVAVDRVVQRSGIYIEAIAAL